MDMAMGSLRVNRAASAAGRARLPYPEHKVIGVVGSMRQALAAIADLEDQGVGSEAIELFYGEAGARRVGAVVARRGVRGWLNWALRGLSDELEHVQRHVEALRAGEALVAVAAPDAATKRRACEALRRHGGHFINHYGTWTIEALAA